VSHLPAQTGTDSLHRHHRRHGDEYLLPVDTVVAVARIRWNCSRRPGWSP